MTNSSRLNMIRLLAFTVLVLVSAAISRAQERPPVAEQMAKTYGLDSFGQIEKIRYTFHLELPGVKIARTWEWEPKTGQISYESKDKDGKPVKVTYQQGEAITRMESVIGQAYVPKHFRNGARPPDSCRKGSPNVDREDCRGSRSHSARLGRAGGDRIIR